MFGMPERITSDDIKTLDDWFKESNLADCEFNNAMKILVKKIDLLVKQDEISHDAGQKITELQDEIVALYKEDKEDVQKEEKSE